MAKIDSGADLNIISTHYLDKLPVHLKNKIKYKNSEVYCANGSTARVLGEIALPVDIVNTKVSVKFHVMDEGHDNVYLGIPFLRQHSAILTFGNSDQNLLSMLLGMSVFSENFVEIQPYTEAVISGILQAPVPSPSQGYCFPTNGTYGKGFMAAHAAVTAYDNSIPVRLFNSQPFKITINKGERIASFQIFDTDIELLPYDNQAPHINSLSSEIHDSGIKATPSHTVELNLENSELEDGQKQQLQNLVSEFSDCFVNPADGKLGLTDLVECKIETVPGTVPVCKYPYRLAPHMREAMGRILEEQVDKGLIEESTEGAWASPALLVKKSSGDFRLVIDYRGLNSSLIPQNLRIPRIDEVFDTIGENQPQFFSVLDCTQGFHQVPLDKDSRDKTAFITPMGKYRYKTMPQGMRNAPVVFQSLMDLVLRGIQFKYVMVYIDDICIFSSSFEQHLAHLREVFSRLRRANLKLHPKKCKFAVQEVNYLGHVLSPQGIQPNPDKVKAIISFPTPSKLKQLRSFLGMIGYYRKFIRNFGVIAKVLYDLTKKDVPYVWSDECEKAFQELKGKMLSYDVLVFPNFKKPFLLATDASISGLGACLSQEVNGVYRPVGFAGRGLTSAERNYTTTEQECLAVIWAIQHFRVYLEGQHFELHTDHNALRYILTSKDPRGRIARWVTFLQQFDYSVKHVKGKENVVPDALSRRDYDFTRTQEDEAIDRYPDLGVISLHNNLEKSNIAVKPTKVSFSSLIDTVEYDSHSPVSSLANQGAHFGDKDTPVWGAIKTKAPSKINARREKLRPTLTQKAAEHFEEIDLSRENIRREQMRDPECKLIIKYLTLGTLPDSDTDARSILLRQEDYIIIDGLLYHIFTPTGSKPSAQAQLVIPQNLKVHFLRLYHDNDLGAHVGNNKMLSIMRLKYYWIGMTTDIREYVLTCPKCQLVKSTTGGIVPPLQMREVTPHAFHTLVIDTVGPLTKSQGYEHLVCVMDQYSKYVIAWPIRDVTAATIVKKLHEKVICVYGAPRRIVSDNGPAFASALFAELCKLYNIKHTLSCAYHPQSQGSTERNQKSIITLIRAFVNQQQTNWAHYLHSVVWALNCTEAQAVGTSPFMLIFGRVPLSPADISLPDPFDAPKSVLDHFLEILARQEVASQHAEAQLALYQKKMKEYFDKHKATNKSVAVGDTVFVYQPKLRAPKTKKKLQAKYHGPYTVVRFTNPSAVILRNLSTGRTLNKSVNINRLKVGYVRAEVNAWDPLEVDSDEEPLEEEDFPPSSFRPADPKDLSPQSSTPTADTPDTTTPNDKTTYQDQVKDCRIVPLTPPVTRLKSKTKIPVLSPPTTKTPPKVTKPPPTPSKIPRPTPNLPHKSPSRPLPPSPITPPSRHPSKIPRPSRPPSPSTSLPSTPIRPTKIPRPSPKATLTGAKLHVSNENKVPARRSLRSPKPNPKYFN